MKNTTLTLIALTGLLAACPDRDSPDPPAQIDESILAPSLGEPMNGASAEQLETFERGREVAEKRFSTADGLGPKFNVSFCGACHEQPVTGGSSPRYRDFLLAGATLEDGSFVGLGVNGVLANFSLLEPYREPTPDQANTFARRNAIPFFGVGALAAIDEASILANADPDDADGDGISGRPNYDRGFVGRFGRKAQTVSIEGFIRGPLFNHLGVTSNPLSPELKAALPVPSAGEMDFREAPLICINCQAAAPEEPNTDNDGIPDPELSEQDLFDLVSFSMLLGAPTPDEPTEETARGAGHFEEAQCAACHVPSLRGPDGLVPAYSDLLVHDMGDELADGIPMGDASGREFRTQPLWGVASVGPYLHDGRAETLDEAIRWHGGEAQASKEAYEALSDSERAELIAFLESLGGKDQVSKGLLPPNAEIPAPDEFGGPLEGADLQAFREGREVFDQDFAFYDGLGGINEEFNGDSCRACHFEPVIGGAGPIGLNVIREGNIDESSGQFTGPESGTLVHRFSIHDARPAIDANTNVFEMRQTPPLFGLGLIDRIPEAEIAANADPDDMDSDGISGRAHTLDDGRVGRFGWKASLPTLEDFVRDALFNELGLTLENNASYVADFDTDDDSITDPEFSGGPYESLVFYVANLAPPPAGPEDAEGAQIFADAQCASCHVPAMTTSDGLEVRLYSDLLLHDVAEASYRGIGEGDAGPREFRTTPLWGVGASGPYMHDGTSPTIEDAILAHHGEATSSREAYEALAESEQQRLLEYVRSR